MSELIPPVPGRWFQPAEADPDAELRVFLFHYAGGGASVWRDWQELMPGDVTVQCVQLPGRQERLGERPFTTMDSLVDAVRTELVAELDERPYALFGHCMGGQLAYRTAVAVERAGFEPPALLGISAWAPRGFDRVTPERARLPEQELVAWVRGLGSLPPDAYSDPALLALVMPGMRADLLACSSYVDDGARVTCPVVTYSAREDPLLTRGANECWAERTPAYLGNCEFPGGHFFVHRESVAITTDFVRLLRRSAAAAVR